MIKRVLVTAPASHMGVPHRRGLSLAVPSMAGLSHEDKIVKFYRSVRPVVRKPLPCLDGMSLTNINHGLGDTLILTDMPKASAGRVPIYSSASHFPELMRFVPKYVPGHGSILVNAPTLISEFNCGAGHFIQRLQRAFGCRVIELPKGCIHAARVKKKPRVVLHFAPGPHAKWQAQHVHPQARQLYPANKRVIERFIAERPEFEFIQIRPGENWIKGAIPLHDTPLAATIELLASAQYFIGIMSGPMHMATALGVKCVVIVNFPDPNVIFLPTLRDTGLIESEWFYPQNVHLHQDSSGPLVKKLSLRTLHRAFAGELYPHWRIDYLQLMHEKI